MIKTNLYPQNKSLIEDEGYYKQNNQHTARKVCQLYSIYTVPDPMESSVDAW